MNTEKIRYPASVFKHLRKYPIRHCEVCGKQLTPNLNDRGKLELMQNFLLRKACSPKCKGRLIRNAWSKRREAEKKKQAEEDAKPWPQKAEKRFGAAHSASDVPAHKREPLQRAKSTRRKELKPRTCVMCGKPFTVGNAERPSMFLKRSTCTPKCAVALRTQQNALSDEEKPITNPLDETSSAYGGTTKEALRMFHDRYPGLTPHAAWQDYGEDATAYWIECLEMAGALGERVTT